ALIIANCAIERISSGEAAKMIGVSDGYLRQLSLDGKGPQPDIAQNGRRSYTLGQINELRQYMDKLKPKDALSYQPWRRP
ncbi:plasmid partitioning protein RepA, partial [Rhizobium ruizarguesonis]